MNEVFVLRQPKSAVLAVIMINPESYPLLEDYHKELLRLGESGIDTMFLFSAATPKKISMKRFSSLYRAGSWISGKGSSLQRTLLGALEYEKHIFQEHSGIAVCRLSDISESGLPDMECLKVSGLAVRGPVMKRSALSSLELYGIYSNPEPSGRSLFKKRQDPSEVCTNMYCTHTSTSPCIFFRPSLVDKILALGDEFIDSFNLESDPRPFLASAITYSGTDFLDMNVENVKA